MRPSPIALGAFLLCAPAAFAGAVGHVSDLEGAATRTPAHGAPVPLAKGAEIDLGDTLAVAASGNLELALSDESTLEVKGGSKLHIDDARFGDLQRHVSLRLLAGAVWAAVSHMGSDSSFQVTTSRAVAGVRGTIFRVDVEGTGDAAQTTVEVQEGEVAVRHAGVVPAAGSAPAQDLTKGQALRVSHAGWRRIAAQARLGRFARFVARHRARALRRAAHLRRFQRLEKRRRQRRHRRHPRWRRWKRLQQ